MSQQRVINIKIDDIYNNIIEDVETRLYTSNYELERLLGKGKNKKVIGLMKNESGGKIMTIFVGLRAKTYSYLIDDASEDKKGKDTKKCVTKRKIKFENYKNCLETTQLDEKINYLEKNEINIDSLKKDKKEFIKNNKLILKTQQRFKSEMHNKEMNKTALSSNDDKRKQSIDSIETYTYGTSKDVVSDKGEIKCNEIIK